MIVTKHGGRAAVLAAAMYCFLVASVRPASCGWQTFTPRDGLASSFVYSLLEDREKNLWFGTSNGVTRSDGGTWRTFTTADGLAKNTINDILEDTSGNLWFATQGGGVSRFDGSTWETFTTEIGLSNNFVQDIEQGPTGNLWFATHYGVCRYNGTSWVTFEPRHGLGGSLVYSLLEDHTGTLWAGLYQGGVSRYDGSSWRTFTTTDGLAGMTVSAILEDRAGNLWFGTDRGLSRYDGSTWQTYLTGHSINSLLEDRAGNLWVGVSGLGVYVYEGSTWRRLDGLSSSFVLLEDASGNMWFSTGGGVIRYDRSMWQTFTDTDGRSIVEDTSGNLWFGSSSGLSRYDGSTWRTFTTSDGLACNPVYSILRDRAGNLWFGTHCDSAGALTVSRYDGATWQTLTRPSVPWNGTITDILEDRAGNLWFAMDSFGGVTRYDGSAWRTFTSADGLASDVVRSILEDRAGNLWFGTNSGATRYDGSTFTFASGGPVNLVYSILEDRSGNLWFGTSGGVTRYDGSTWQAIPEVGRSGVRKIVEDLEGNLWFATSFAVTRYDGSKWTTVTADDGLAHNFVFDILEDRTGNLWFGSLNGVSRFEPDRLPPRTVFLVVPPNVSSARTHTIAFTAAFEKLGIEFSHRLDGGPWSEWSTNNTWFGSDLPDGSHTIEVRSRDTWNNGEPSPAIAGFLIDATPPQPILSSPAFGQPVRARVEVRGTAMDSRFTGSRVRFRPSGATSWNPPDAVVLAESATPVADGLLATWDTSPIPDGSYELRLDASDSLGLTGSTQVAVIVDNHAPYFDQTAPATVTAAAGGDIYTTNAETHLYVPPRAFAEDAIVMVTALDGSVPNSPLPGAVKVLDGYEIAWTGTLEKPARFTLSYDGATLPGGDLAVYRSTDGVSWERLGGTVDVGRKSISLAISVPGRYALFADNGVGSGTASLSSIAFTPRVFSPTGGFADRQVGISFRLGRSAPVNVKVFSPSGRLIREVATGVNLHAGENMIPWDGMDRNGGYVVDGVYLVTVEAFGRRETKTLAVVR